MYIWALILACVAAVALGGDLRKLSSLEIKRLPWILCSFLTPFIVQFIPNSDNAVVSAAATLFSYAVLLYGLSANLRVPGISAVGLGAVLNLAVIAANSFKMPVSLDYFEAEVAAQEAARLAGSASHAVLSPTSRLPFLADVIPWRFLVSRPSMVSIGDVFIACGVAWMVFRTARPRFFR